MPFEYTIDSDQQLVVSRATGTVTDAEVITHRNRLMKDSSFDPSCYNQLIDMTHVEQLDLSATTIQNLIRNNPWGHGTHRALVAPTTVLYGISRMIQNYLEGNADTIEIFDSVETALQWLGQRNPEQESMQ